LVVRPDGRWEVRGASSVIIFDARAATRDASAVLLQTRDVRTHVLTEGGTFDPSTGIAVLGSSRTP
jgi:hypothetical protein